MFLSTLQPLQKVGEQIGVITNQKRGKKVSYGSPLAHLPKCTLLTLPPPPPTTIQLISLETALIAGEMKNKGYAIWGGGRLNKVQHGRCTNGELIVIADLSGTSLLSADMYIPGSTVITIPGCSPRPLLTKCVS